MNKLIIPIKADDILLKFILYSLPLLIILGNALVNTALFIVVIIYFYKCIKSKKLLFSKDLEFKIFLFFYIYLVFNSLQSHETLVSLIRTVPYLKFFIFILVYKDLIEQKKISLNSLGIFWIIIIALLNLDIILQSITGADVFGFNSGLISRNSGFFFDELVAGSFLVSFSFISILLVTNKKNDYFLFFFLLFCLVTVLLSGERSSFLKFLLMFFIFFIFFKNKLNLLNYKKSISIVAIFFSIIIYLNGSVIKERYFGMISFSHNQNLSLIDKYLTSQYGAHSIVSFFIFKDNLLLGAGNKSFRFECEKYSLEVKQIQTKIDDNLDYYSSGCSTHPHQIYNELTSEHGIIGTLLVLLLVSKLLLTKIFKEKLSLLNIVSLLYIATVFLPILPSGSFFSTFNSTLIWVNFLFYSVKSDKQ